MTKKQAKKEASHITARLLENYLEVGQPYEDCFNGLYKDHRGSLESDECPDCDAIYEQLRVYIAEMDRRAQ